MGNAKRAREVVVVQALRALAALLVVCSHSHSSFEQGAIGVDIFFAISGFVMVLSTESLRNKADAAFIFLRRRVVRIVPMYWVFTSLVLLLDLYHRHAVAGVLVAKSFFFIPAHVGGPAKEIYFPLLGVGWTLVYEVFFYACFALCLLWRMSPLLLFPIFAILAVPGIVHPVQSSAILSLFNWRLLEFVAGMAMAKLYQRGRLLSLPVAAVGCVAGLAAICYFPADTHTHHMLIWAPAVMLLVYACLTFEGRLLSRLPFVVELLANSSYSIYLCHQDFILPAIEHRTYSLTAHPYALWALKVALCLVAGAAVHFALERPILRFFSVRIGGRPPSQAA